jgi:hypothetical protein
MNDDLIKSSRSRLHQGRPVGRSEPKGVILRSANASRIRNPILAKKPPLAIDKHGLEVVVGIADFVSR